MERQREKELQGAAERTLRVAMENPSGSWESLLLAAEVNPSQGFEVLKLCLDWHWITMDGSTVVPIGADAEGAAWQVRAWADEAAQLVHEQYDVRKAVLSPLGSGMQRAEIITTLHIPADWWNKVRAEAAEQGTFVAHGRGRGVRYYPAAAADDIPNLGQVEEEPKKHTPGRRRRGGPSSATRGRVSDVAKSVTRMFNAREGDNILSRGVKRADLVAATGLSQSAWNTTVRQALDQEQVVKYGSKRGTRYFPASVAKEVREAEAAGLHPARALAARKVEAERRKAEAERRKAKLPQDTMQAAALVEAHFNAAKRATGGVGARGASRSDLQGGLGASNNQWQRIARQLVEHDLAVKVGDRRGTRYFPKGTRVTHDDIVAARSVVKEAERLRARAARGPITVTLRDAASRKAISAAQASGRARSPLNAVQQALAAWSASE